MERRKFIKTSAVSSAFLATSGLLVFDQATSKAIQSTKYCFQSDREIPIAYNIDVVVVGGSTAGVAAAVNAAQNGATVLLAAQEPYLGEDICGNYHYWVENKGLFHTELSEKIFKNGLPSPLYVKSVLNNELINNNIDFLYSSYVTDLLVDGNNTPAGVVISNRSGRQAVVAKVIIDATPRAMVTRMANTKFMEYPNGKQQFKFVVVGNKKISGSNLSAREMPEPIKVDDKIYRALEYTIDIEMKDGSWASFAQAEQKIRDLTWDANQVDSADLIFQVPPDNIYGRKRWSKTDLDVELIDLKVFMPHKIDNIFVLSGCADLSREAASNLLQPGGLIHIGERIGNEAAIIASGVTVMNDVHVPGETKLNTIKGDVKELLEGIRPSINIGRLRAETTSLPVLDEFDVVVVGGGTAGAPSAIGASRKGAKTLVIEYLHGLGGIGTMGMIGRYWYGYKEGFTNEMDLGVKNIGGDNPRKKQVLKEWVVDWKMEWLRSEIRKAKGDIWFGVIGCGAYVENNQIKGVVVATPYGKGVVLGHTVIDSTGSSDIAIAAKAAYNYTDGNEIAVQGAGFSHKDPDDFYNNSDWTFTDDTDMLDVWRTFVLGTEKYEGRYDVVKLPLTRERRRIIGDFTVSVLDAYNNRTYPDTISVYISSFDSHGFSIDPFLALKPPAESNVLVTTYVPIRSLLPKGLEGIIVTGLGISAHRDVMPVIRSQPCIQNQGYSVGMAAAMVSSTNQTIRYINIKELQKKLVAIESLPESVLIDEDNYPPSMEAVQKAAKTIVNKLEGLEIILWDKSQGIPALIDAFHMISNEEQKLIYALILGLLKNNTGWEVLKNKVGKLEDWDKGWNFTGMGQFGFSMSYIDSLIIALGNSQKAEAIASVVRMAKMLTPQSEFSHFRSIALAFESLASKNATKTLFDMLHMQGMTGHSQTKINQALRETPAGSVDVSLRNLTLRELFLGRALYRCGDYNGLGKQILQDYSKDLCGHYARYASEVLELSGKKSEKPNI